MWPKVTLLVSKEIRILASVSWSEITAALFLTFFSLPLPQHQVETAVSDVNKVTIIVVLRQRQGEKR